MEYDERIDVAKGIGMILLVVGHLLTIDSSGFKVIFGFHMPLFFFLSGYLFVGDKYNRKDFYSKKIFKLVLSYLFFTLIGLLIYLGMGWLKDISVKYFIFSVFYLGEPAINTNLWFLCTLIIVMIVYYNISILSKSRIKWNEFIAVIILCMTVSWSLNYVPLKYIPLKLNTIPLAFMWFFIGNRSSRMKHAVNCKNMLIGGGQFCCCYQLNTMVE